MRSIQYDALIVGARPAGAATAMLLARAGARVLLVDRAEPGTDTMSTHSLTRGGVIQLARWGVLDRVRAAGTPAIRQTTLHYGAESIALNIRTDDEIDGLIAPRRTVLDRILADTATEAGAELRYQTSFRDVLRDGVGRVTGAVLAAADGTTHEVGAKIVVGADGRRSTMARRVAAEPYKQSRHAAAHVYAYVQGLPDTGTHLHFSEGIGLGRIPTNDGLHCIVVSLPPERYLADRRTSTSGPGFTSLAAEAAPELADELASARIVERPIGFAGEFGYARQSYGPGWALVGDAGYFKDPVTAHGITDALRDAEILAAAILTGGDAALAHYQRTRDVISSELFAITDEIAALDWTLSDVKDMHRRLNFALKTEQAWITDTLAERRAAA